MLLIQQNILVAENNVGFFRVFYCLIKRAICIMVILLPVVEKGVTAPSFIKSSVQETRTHIFILFPVVDDGANVKRFHKELLLFRRPPPAISGFEAPHTKINTQNRNNTIEM